MEVKRPSSLSWLEVLFGSSLPVGSEETKEPGLGWGSLPRPPSRHQRGAPWVEVLSGPSPPVGSEETIEPVLGGGPLRFLTASWQ